MECPGCDRTIRDNAVVCVYCDRTFTVSPEQKARAVADAVATQRFQDAAWRKPIKLEPNSTERAYDETAYYTWSRFHWPWQLPRISWFGFWLRDAFIYVAAAAAVLGVVALVQVLG